MCCEAPRGRRSISQALNLSWRTPVSPDAFSRLASCNLQQSQTLPTPRDRQLHPLRNTLQPSLTGLMDGDQQMLWASHYFAAMAKALLDDAELELLR
ncbi:hypothetical protein [Pseudomonas inefficax]|uniref:hypothetical protein n=1 Tax=Pseudomonas inefficax TaxID=2078786 RepID=UPI002DBFBCC3|nr:hypothetical protein [Pseudomonas sp. CMAA1741]MEC4563705.1 hypothetical protein [Pseudomonas sp. CMAA1741]